MNGYLSGQSITKIGHFTISVNKSLTIPHKKAKVRGSDSWNH